MTGTGDVIMQAGSAGNRIWIAEGCRCVSRLGMDLSEV